MTTALDAIPFPPTGDMLWARRDTDGRVFVAVRPICLAIGLAWGSQRNRLQRNPVLSEGVFMMNTPSAGGEQATICLPLDLIPGWLMGIDVNRVKAGLRDRLIAFQRECYRVLAVHFGVQPAPAEAEPLVAPEPEPVERLGAAPAPTAGLNSIPERTARLWIDSIREARLLGGREAGVKMWQMSPLPQVLTIPQGGAESEDAEDEVSDGVEAFNQFALIRSPGAKTPASEMYAAYCRFWTKRGGQPISQTAFGRRLNDLKIRKVHCGLVYYLNVMPYSRWCNDDGRPMPGRI